MQKKKTRKLCFNFRRIHKKEVYQAFLAIYTHGGIELTNEELIYKSLQVDDTRSGKIPYLCIILARDIKFNEKIR